VVSFFSQSSSFLTRAPRADQMLVNDKLIRDLIDIPGMGSPATAVNRAATGKRQANFILSTEDQAVTIDSCKKQIRQTSKSDLASNERTALKTNEELDDKTESKQSINQSHILTCPVRVTHLPTHTHIQTHPHHTPTTSSPCSITSKHPPLYLQDATRCSRMDAVTGSLHDAATCNLHSTV
jgi:hypothetical protein